ncbi:MAG TPA: hypothetical protein VF057_03540 [Thermoanaerobaculia bacterium]
MTFLLFSVIGAAVLLFAFATVNDHPLERLQSDAGATRSYNTIMWWHEHGYLASGGLMVFRVVPPGATQPVPAFYRSSSGGYMVSGYVIEKIALLATGEYSWKLLAVHNAAITLLTAALLALLVFRAARRLELESRLALAFGVAAQVVFLTFPISLAQYWELSPQMAALPFALLFLLFDDDAARTHATNRRSHVVQFIAAFLLVYMEPFYGSLFLAMYFALTWLRRKPYVARDLIFRTALPVVIAFVALYAQIAWVKIRHSDMPMHGSQFLFRTGLDGSTEYYRDHRDIMFGRDLARRNFPVNREELFRWPVLFTAGCLAVAVVVVSAVRRERHAIVTALVCQIGAYLLYAAIFSQAFVIHPYLYDSFIAMPLVMALFGFAPALAESRWRTNGLVAVAALVTAACCSFVQLRHYAMWYPKAETKAAIVTPDTTRHHADRLVC